MAAGKPKNYRSERALSRAIDAYFASISRTVDATEEYGTGGKDADGHKICDTRPILNDAGETIRYVEYVRPPTVGGLCEFLGIRLRTWDDYCDIKNYPEFFETTAEACGRLRAWREEQLLTRKDVKGIIFALENNYGYCEKKELKVGPAAENKEKAAMSMGDRMTMLREIAKSFGASEEAPDQPGGGAGSPVVRGTSAQPDDDLGASARGGMEHELADPEGGRLVGTLVLADQGQSCACGHLYDRGITVHDAVESFHPFEIGTRNLHGDPLSAHRSQEGVDAPLSAVSNRQRDHFGSGIVRADGLLHDGTDLRRAHGPLE
jgi:hypothetical protein